MYDHKPFDIYFFKGKSRITRKMCEISFKLTIKTSEGREWYCSDVFLLTLNIFHTFLCCFYDCFEQVNVSW